MSERSVDRREFAKYASAAVAGTVAAVGLSSSVMGADEKNPKSKKHMLLLEPHVCKGLNACKGLGGCGESKGKNTCAGSGGCATAERHTCKGDNVCGGTGGCGEHPGENGCKGSGGCAVPLSEDTWKTLRARFEEVAKESGMKVQPAPKA
jgi:hypothetical protein